MEVMSVNTVSTPIGKLWHVVYAQILLSAPRSKGSTSLLQKSLTFIQISQIYSSCTNWSAFLWVLAQPMAKAVLQKWLGVMMRNERFQNDIFSISCLEMTQV